VTKGVREETAIIEFVFVAASPRLSLLTAQKTYCSSVDSSRRLVVVLWYKQLIKVVKLRFFAREICKNLRLPCRAAKVPLKTSLSPPSSFYSLLREFVARPGKCQWRDKEPAVSERSAYFRRTVQWRKRPSSFYRRIRKYDNAIIRYNQVTINVSLRFQGTYKRCIPLWRSPCDFQARDEMMMKMCRGRVRARVRANM